MKLINIYTHEIVVFGEGVVDLNRIGCKNVAEMLAAGWEDYKEPKEYWYIGDRGEIFPEIAEEPGHIWHQARKKSATTLKLKRKPRKP